MTDLHTHILPGIDDGAPDLEASLRLLEMQRQQGVRNIAMTSHFSCDDGTVEDFLERREAAWAALREKIGTAEDFNIKLGSEVYFSPRLLQLDVRRLCLEGTNVLLLELPMNQRPQFLQEVLCELRDDGIIPLLAHVERYAYVGSDPTIVADWLELGAYAQVNAGSVLAGGERKRTALRLLQWELAQVVASDTHSPERRPPRLRQAMTEIERQLGLQAAERLQTHGQRLFQGMEPEKIEPHRPKRFLAWWF